MRLFDPWDDDDDDDDSGDYAPPGYEGGGGPPSTRVPTQNDPDWTPPNTPGYTWAYVDGVGWRATPTGGTNTEDPPPGPQTYTDYRDYNTGSLSGGGWGAAPTYTAPDWLDPGEFDPGPAFSYKDFLAPDPSKVGDDPAFKFRFDQGLKALSATKAGQGTFRSGATGQALQDYGQNAASQEYNNIWNRSLSEYDTNRNNAFGSWAAQYGQRKDAYGFKASNTQNHNIFNQGNASNTWRSLFDAWAKEGDWMNSYLTSLAQDPG